MHWGWTGYATWTSRTRAGSPGYCWHGCATRRGHARIRPYLEPRWSTPTSRWCTTPHGATRRRRDLYEDVVQTGIVGLIKAIDRYDPERGDEFASFALPTITGEIKRFFRDTGWGVHVPRGQQERFLAVTRAQEELRQELGRDGTEQEIAAHLDTTVEDVRLGREAEHAYSVDSLDAVRNRPEGDPGQASTERLGAEEPEFDLVDFKVSCRPACIADLDERDRTILRLRFWGDKTQREIGRELGISQMHVSRLLKRVLDQLRTLLESEHGRAVRV
ncbi:sigma-70 family RNA polymerase sigma factor [Yinghuangia aomiensis]